MHILTAYEMQQLTVEEFRSAYKPPLTAVPHNVKLDIVL